MQLIDNRAFKHKKGDIRLFNISLFSFYYYNRLGWFRMFGRGLKWKDTTIHSLIFSERNGYSKGIQIGKWRIGTLPKPKH